MLSVSHQQLKKLLDQALRLTSSSNKTWPYDDYADRQYKNLI